MLKSILVLFVSILIPLSSAIAKPKLLFSITPIASIAAMVINDEAEINVISNSTGCPEHYSLKPSDLKKAQEADLIIFINEDFDTFASKLAEKTSGKFLRITDIKGLNIISTNGSNNLHLWLDLDNVEIILKEFASTFKDRFPELRDKIDNNLNQANEQIELLKKARDAKISHDLSKVIIISDSVEYLLGKTNASKMYAGHYPSIKYMNNLKNALHSGKDTIILSKEQEGELKFLEQLNAKLIVLESENWLFQNPRDLKNMFFDKYKRMIDSLDL
jgi:zinc transport system substrate-binding protein